MVKKVLIYKNTGPKGILIIFLCLMVSLTTHAQKLVATASETHIGLEDAIMLKWTISAADASAFTLPAGMDQNFLVLQGPSESRSYTVINNRYESELSISFIVKPLRTGTISIGQARIRMGQKVILSNSLSINVISGYAGRAERGANNGEKECFIRAVTDKTHVVEGEAINLTYKLYLRNAEIDQHNFRLSPSLSGFWVKDIPDAVDNTLREETVNGKTYYSTVLKKAVIYPQKKGALVCDAMEVEGIIYPHTANQQTDVFGRPIRGMGEHKVIRSNSVPLMVDPLPDAGKPKDFSGLVGQFQLQASARPSSLKEYEALTYKVMLLGEGNFAQVGPFKLDLPKEWDAYDPQEGDVNGYGKAFEYTLVPLKRGNYTLPGLSFSYYNPQTKKYERTTTQPIAIEVKPGEAGSADKYKKADKKDIGLHRRELHYIREGNGHLSEGEENSFFGSLGFLALTVLPFISFFGLIMVRRRREAKRKLEASPTHKAGAVAEARLSAAREGLQKGDQVVFYGETHKALFGYILDRTGIPMAEATHENIRAALKEKKIAYGDTENLLRLIDDCEYARYAPTSKPEDMGKIYEEAAMLIGQLEEQFKRTKA